MLTALGRYEVIKKVKNLKESQVDLKSTKVDWTTMSISFETTVNKVLGHALGSFC